MIIIHNFYEWVSFFEFVGNYEVWGEIMAEPDPTTGEPILHDIIIKEIWDVAQEKDLTSVVDHDYIAAHIEREIL